MANETKTPKTSEQLIEEIEGLLQSQRSNFELEYWEGSMWVGEEGDWSLIDEEDLSSPITRTDGWIARLQMPGYLDSTDPHIGDTLEEVLQNLIETDLLPHAS